MSKFYALCNIYVKVVTTLMIVYYFSKLGLCLLLFMFLLFYSRSVLYAESVAIIQSADDNSTTKTSCGVLQIVLPTCERFYVTVYM